MRLILFFLFLSFSPSFWAMGQESQQVSNDPLIGQSTSDVLLAKSDGTRSGVLASRQGKKAIMVFWATWCPHCYEEMGAINAQFSSIERKGIKIILVDMGETNEDVKNYFDQRQMKLISFVDGDGVMQEPYRLIGVPTLIFIDEKGIIRNVTHEFPSDYEKYFSS